MKFKDLGEIIAHNLQKQDKSQTWLAEITGVTKSHICHIIAGRCKPSTKLLLKISKTLDIDIKIMLELL
ncbi:MAG: helix-turn-helix domain-containing protein [Tepidibacter sp.]|uniref:helix-turn-helix domain-containing protein n=1 Tax=Tepidibacter sp. TaxID=2529387 RepID=UPI0025F85E78|nr:helix-turn-helix transcriptional regulator [Tepidibacter sp.]MCT4509915.1 helix-turn-helix domain-containing protein [Tepidibacter sp.]